MLFVLSLLLQWLLKHELLSITARLLVLTLWPLKPWKIIELNPFSMQSVFLNIFLYDIHDIPSSHITQKGRNFRNCEWCLLNANHLEIEFSLCRYHQPSKVRKEVQCLIMLWLSSYNLFMKVERTVRQRKTIRRWKCKSRTKINYTEKFYSGYYMNTGILFHVKNIWTAREIRVKTLYQKKS